MKKNVRTRNTKAKKVPEISYLCVTAPPKNNNHKQTLQQVSSYRSQLTSTLLTIFLRKHVRTHNTKARKEDQRQPITTNHGKEQRPFLLPPNTCIHTWAGREAAKAPTHEGRHKRETDRPKLKKTEQKQQTTEAANKADQAKLK